MFSYFVNKLYIYIVNNNKTFPGGIISLQPLIKFLDVSFSMLFKPFGRLYKDMKCPHKPNIQEHTHTGVYLEGHTADREVAAIFKHVEVLRHQGGAMHQTVCCLRMVPSLRVLPCHVLQPREPQIRRVLIALSNPTQRRAICTYSTGATLNVLWFL